MLGLHEAERSSNNIQNQCLLLLSSHQKPTLTASRLSEELTVYSTKDDNHMVSLPMQNYIEHHMIWKRSAYYLHDKAIVNCQHRHVACLPFH
jgi:hypothetical protein